MNYYRVNYSRGQMKIQQMAFVLVALMILFGMVALFYFSIKSASLKDDVEKLRKEKVQEAVRKIVGSPEFLWSIYDCSSCVDLDKVFSLKDRKEYEGFWKGISYLQVVKVYPKDKIEECVKGVYPECNTITLIDNKDNFVSYSSFVSLCRYDTEEGYTKCELGKIIMGFETV